MSTTIIVPMSYPQPPSVESTHYRVDVLAPPLVGMTDAPAHFALAKFRRAAHHFVDWESPDLGDAPTAGPHEHEVRWLSSPFAEHAAVVLGVQSYAASADPSVTITLIDLDDGDADVDADGVVWQASTGTLPEPRENRGGSWRYHIHFISTGVRAVEASEISGPTGPRCLNIPSAVRGNRLAVQISAEYVRVWSVTVFERLVPSYVQE